MARLLLLPRLLGATFPSGRARWVWQPPSGQNVPLIFLLNNLPHSFLTYFPFSKLYLSYIFYIRLILILQRSYFTYITDSFFLFIQRDLLFPCSLQKANRQDCTWVLDEENRKSLSQMCDSAHCLRHWRPCTESSALNTRWTPTVSAI